MATVHRATIELGGGLRREVALKRLLPHLAEDDRFVEDFVREAKLAVHLRHPNIIQIYDLGRIGADYFIAMELVRGIPLMTLMRVASKQDRLLSVGAVLSLMIELTDALDHAHTGATADGQPLQLVHRDLTPSNLLVTDDGHLKIIDFGIAKAMRGDLATDSGRAKGKLGYMALEALKAEPVDARADLFSAGVVMWELLTNRRLFKAPDDWDLVGAIRETVVEPPSIYNPECTPALDELVLHAVAKRREDRWQSAAALHSALVAIAREFAATPNEVIQCKHGLRPETSGDPYAGFELELDADEPAPARAQRRLDWTGQLWTAEPNTEPKLQAQAEGTSSWPIEPVTEPKLYSVDIMAAARGESQPEFPPESPSVSVRELPVQFLPSDFGGDTPVGAPRFLDSNPTEELPVLPPPIPEPPASPRKVKSKEQTETRRMTRPKPAPAPPLKPAGPTKLGAIKPTARATPPPPFRNKPPTVRNPAPSPVIDRLKEFAGDTSAEGEQFVDDSDTHESREFDDE